MMQPVVSAELDATSEIALARAASLAAITDVPVVITAELADLPRPTLAIERELWCAAAGTEAPSPAVRMRALRAAYAASLDDDVQRLALREAIAHFRAWCMANGHADAVREEPVRRIVVSRPRTIEPKQAVPA